MFVLTIHTGTGTGPGIDRYKNTFTSFLKMEKTTESSVWKQSVGLDQHQNGSDAAPLTMKEQIELEKITVGEYLARFNQVQYNSIPAPV